MERNALLKNGAMKAVRMECPMRRQHICLTVVIQKRMGFHIIVHILLLSTSLLVIISKKELRSNEKRMWEYYPRYVGALVSSFQ